MTDEVTARSAYIKR